MSKMYKKSHNYNVTTITKSNGTKEQKIYDSYTTTDRNPHPLGVSSIVSLILLALIIICFSRIYTGEATLEFADLLDFIDDFSFNHANLSTTVNAGRVFTWSGTGIIGWLAGSADSTIGGGLNFIGFLVGCVKYCATFVFKFINFIFGF